MSVAEAPGASWPSGAGTAASVKARGECGATEVMGVAAELETMTAGMEAEAASGANPCTIVSPLLRRMSTAPCGSPSLRLSSVESAVSMPVVRFFSLPMGHPRVINN